MAYSYSFDEKQSLCKSKEQEIIELLYQIFNARLVAPNPASGDDKGIDYFVYVGGEGDIHKLNIDVKYRDIECPDDLALETWSNIERQNIGWTRDTTKQTDYVVWLWADNVYKALPFKSLCSVFADNWESWKKQYKTARQLTPTGAGYHSECIFVPIKKVEDAIAFYEFLN